MWNQAYDPLNSPVFSTLIAALPLVVLLGLLARHGVRAHYAALLGLAAALAVAIVAQGMPAGMALRAAAFGAAYGFFPIGWIVLNVLFLHALASERGLVDELRVGITRLTADRRLQLLFVAFCFGAFFEGAAGFGTPVAVTGALLIALGFGPLEASGLSLIANTAPVAYGALGTPIIALQGVTGLDLNDLSAMVGRQLPLFSLIVKKWFRSPINDVYCGLRGFTKEHYERLDQRCTGMEFATEMIIKSSIYSERLGVRIAEVPITLYPDGRKSHAPHLKTFRDGWRTLRFFLLYSPRWLFLIPGLLLILSGAVGYIVALPRLQIGAVSFDAHTLLFASLFVLCGYQSVLFAILTKTFAISERLMPSDPRMDLFFQVVNLERVIFAASTAMMIGVILLGIAVNVWRNANFGNLNYSDTMRLVIPGATLVALGFQTVLSGFFASILGMKRK